MLLREGTVSAESLTERWIPKLYRVLTLDQARYECRLRGVGESEYLRGCLKRLVADDLARKQNPSLHPMIIQDTAPVTPEVYNLMGSEPGEAQAAADKYAGAMKKFRQGLGPAPKRSAMGTFVEDEHGRRELRQDVC